MRKRLSVLTVALFATYQGLFAQNQFISSLNEILNSWIRPAYPIIAGMIFIVGALINMGHFFGDNRDIKKGIGNIFIYLAVALVIVGIFEAILAITI